MTLGQAIPNPPSHITAPERVDLHRDMAPSQHQGGGVVISLVIPSPNQDLGRKAWVILQADRRCSEVTAGIDIEDPLAYSFPNDAVPKSIIVKKLSVNFVMIFLQTPYFSSLGLL